MVAQRGQARRSPPCRRQSSQRLRSERRATDAPEHRNPVPRAPPLHGPTGRSRFARAGASRRGLRRPRSLPDAHHTLVRDVGDTPGRLGDKQRGDTAQRPVRARCAAPSQPVSSLAVRTSSIPPSSGSSAASLSTAMTIAATPPFMSLEPRPLRRPWRNSPNGSTLQGVPPSPTVSRCPDMQSRGSSLRPSSRATRLWRPGACSWRSTSNPAAWSRPATSSAAAASEPVVSRRTSSSASWAAGPGTAGCGGRLPLTRS